MKDISYFKKYEISNRLEDVFNVGQDKWKEIGRKFLSYAFDKPLRVIDTTKLKLKDRIQVNLINLMLDAKISKGQIYTIYIKSCQYKMEKSRAKKEFERIWSLSQSPNEYTMEMMAIVNSVKKWDTYFGIS